MEKEDEVLFRKLLNSGKNEKPELSSKKEH